MSVELFDYMCQAILTCCGIGSLYFMASKDARKRLLAGSIGLLGEPFWFATAYINDQYGVMILVFVYGAGWIRVVWTNYCEVYGDPFDFGIF